MAPLIEYPQTWLEPPRGRVLVLAPHADDEAIGCGGVIALHAQRGDAVAIAIATDGALGDPERRFPEHDYVERRRDEARAAAAALGVPPAEHWSLPDQGLARVPDLVARVAEAIARHRAEVVYGPPEDEVHPDHAALGAALRAALAQRTPRPRAFAYEVWVPVRATHVIDVTSVFERKRRALEQYHSQLAYNDYLHAVAGLNAARSIYLPPARYVEAFAEFGDPG
jgi:LmbE family N-acetylglucosaminyl deacetylase